MNQATSNFADIGARGGTGIFPHVKTQSITNGSGETLRQESNLLHGEFGPKLELGHYWVRPFLVAKVGFDKFFLDARPTAFNCLSSATVSPVFYPGGGLQGRGSLQKGIHYGRHKEHGKWS